jgi:hypothetical protein
VETRHHTDKQIGELKMQSKSIYCITNITIKRIVCSLRSLSLAPTDRHDGNEQRRHHRHEVGAMTGLILLPCPHSFNVVEYRNDEL